MSPLMINGDKKAAASNGHFVVRCLGPFQISGPNWSHPSSHLVRHSKNSDLLLITVCSSKPSLSSFSIAGS